MPPLGQRLPSYGRLAPNIVDLHPRRNKLLHRISLVLILGLLPAGSLKRSERHPQAIQISFTRPLVTLPWRTASNATLLPTLVLAPLRRGNIKCW